MHHDFSFEYLSNRLSSLQIFLKKNYSIDKIYIGGGTSRAILDYIYFSEPLKMRDVDIFIYINKICSYELADSIGYVLDTKELGHYSKQDLRARIRPHPYKNIYYEAGFGVFLIDENETILDLSIFNRKINVFRNGIFDIDKIMIPLSYPNSLQDLKKTLSSHHFYEALNKKIIIDRYNGYSNWRKRKCRIIDWRSLLQDPIVLAFRVVRTYSKLGYSDLPIFVYHFFQKHLENITDYNQIQLQRSIEKINLDTNTDWSYSILNKLGILKLTNINTRDTGKNL